MVLWWELHRRGHCAPRKLGQDKTTFFPVLVQIWVALDNGQMQESHPRDHLVIYIFLARLAANPSKSMVVRTANEFLIRN